MVAALPSPTLPDFVRTLRDRFASRPAVVLGDERLAYSDLERRSADLARGLLAQGVTKGTRVGIWMANGPEWVVAFAATARIGALAVPLNTFFQPRELAWALRHADIHTLLLVDRHLGHDLVGRLGEAVPQLSEASSPQLSCAQCPYLRNVVVWGTPGEPWLHAASEVEAQGAGDERFDARLLAAVEGCVAPSDELVMLYTSGSTGDPKGVVHSHGALLRHSHALVSSRDLDSDDVVWSPMPFFWVGGLVYGLLANLHVGATTLCEEAFEPDATLRLLEREGATVALGWPHFGKALAEHPSRKQRDLSRLRAGNLPGILPDSVVSPDPELRPNALGMTETCGPHTRVPEGVLPESLRSTFGQPVEAIEHRVVDLDTGAPLPAGEDGEIQVRGYSLMQRLYKREREDTFLPDGFYATGDVGAFDDDRVLRFRGRRGEMIKTAGANVTPSEVEQAIGLLPGVKHVFVVGVPHPDRGQNVAAAVVPEAGQRPAPDELRAALKRELAAYKVPRHVVFYEELAALPFTDSGKPDRAKLVADLVSRIEADQAER